MRYLAENTLSMVKILKDGNSKSGLMGKLIKLFLAGLVFIFITWLLFGEAIHPKQLILLPFYALMEAGA